MHALRLFTHAIVIALVAQIAAVAAQSPGVSGKWDLTVNSPHGDVTMGLDLTLKGETVSGRLLNFRGADLPVTGTFANGELNVVTTDDMIAIAGTLTDDGSLRGMLSTDHGDLRFTAVRARAGADHVRQ